jgi:hypothetical protein
MTVKNKNWKTVLVDLENKLADFFIKKLPPLPEKAKEVIVKFGPYLVVVSLILTVPAILALLGVGFGAAPFVFLGAGRFGFWHIFSIVVSVLILALELMAIKGLFKREMKAWKLLFYVSLISAFSSLISFDLWGLIIGVGISWYVLFQIRSYYK